MVDINLIKRHKKKKSEKLERFIVLLKKALEEADKEKKNPTIWRLDLVEDVVEPEVSELLEHAEKGEIFFKYGKRQRRLVSTYYMSDSVDRLDSTPLGRSIMDLQDAYDRL